MKNVFPTLIFVIALTFGIVLIYVMQKGQLRQEQNRLLQKEYDVVGSLDFRENSDSTAKGDSALQMIGNMDFREKE